MKRKILGLAAPLLAGLAVVLMGLVLLLAGCWLQQQLLSRYGCRITALRCFTVLLFWVLPGTGLLIASLLYECRRLRQLVN